MAEIEILTIDELRAEITRLESAQRDASLPRIRRGYAIDQGRAQRRLDELLAAQAAGEIAPAPIATDSPTRDSEAAVQPVLAPATERLVFDRGPGVRYGGPCAVCHGSIARPHELAQASLYRRSTGQYVPVHTECAGGKIKHAVGGGTKYRVAPEQYLVVEVARG